jgi:hypothetical protein
MANPRAGSFEHARMPKPEGHSGSLFNPELHLSPTEETMRETRRGSMVKLCIGALMTLAACDQSPMQPSGPNQFLASIEGSIEAAYAGNGFFQTVPHRAVIGRGFSLYSQGHGSAGNQEFQIHSKARPEVGTYHLGHASAETANPIRLEYHVWDGNQGRAFFVETGELEITYSSRDRVEGTFRSTARLGAACERAPNIVGCRTITSDADRPSIQIAGSFQAVAGRFRP